MKMRLRIEGTNDLTTLFVLSDGCSSDTGSTFALHTVREYASCPFACSGLDCSQSVHANPAPRLLDDGYIIITPQFASTARLSCFVSRMFVNGHGAMLNKCDIVNERSKAIEISIRLVYHESTNG